jgi:hypothetical protein
MSLRALLTAALIALPAAAIATGPACPAVRADAFARQQEIRPLPGALDKVLMVNDNNPELIRDEGILLSTFPEGGADVLAVPLNGRFDLFSHHVYAGNDDTLDSTLWLAVMVAPLDGTPVTLELLEGSTSLSQATRPGQTAAPFLPLPAFMRETTEIVAAGPGSRVAGDLLAKRRAPELHTTRWSLEPGDATPIVVLPIPVAGLDPLLNGRNLQLRLRSSAPVALATLAAYGSADTPPPTSRWQEMLHSGELSSKEHSPTPRGAKGKMVYSRVSGVQIGSSWSTRITDPGSAHLAIPSQPLSWPISSLERGSLGTGQVQTAELQAFHPDTAWAAHGNYGVTYDLSLPLSNDGDHPASVELALESPLKSDQPSDSLMFRTSMTGPVMYRGPIEVAGLDDHDGRPLGRQTIHLVLRQGQQGPALGQLTLAPGEQRNVRVRLVYPADATPPQVLTLRPVKQSRTPDT